MRRRFFRSLGAKTGERLDARALPRPWHRQWFRLKMIPRKGLLSGLAGGAICYLFGIPGYISVFFGVVTFLVMGGWRYFQIAAKTLPRDIRLAEP